MEIKKVKVALTQGDINGIGYELIIKAFSDVEMLELCTPVIYGSKSVLQHYAKLLEIPISVNVVESAAEAKEGRINLVDIGNGEPNIETGKRTEESQKMALEAHDRAKHDLAARTIDAMVTAPAEGLPRRNPNQLTLYVNDDIRVLSTEDGALTVQFVQTLHNTLKRDFSVSNPRIAVVDYKAEPTPLNEEMKEVVYGPYSAEKFYEEHQEVYFDALIEVGGRHEITPDMVRVTSGLPIVHTTSIYDERFDIAGQNIADEQSMCQAIYLAVDIVRNRAIYDEPLKNPLPKLYHERKEDGEKVRFNIPKKGEHREDSAKTKE
ncbi:MAG: 4-hydroxythreonine-4-phosphate dehydrogenase PdxA [Prevotella sp.]|nr:4-hydroxythreonine-4-phosphate dehydrogenase PdxA [Prevotella sp.]